MAPVATGAMWLLAPELQWHVGLSGMLHGLIVVGALAGLRARTATTPIHVGALILTAAKITREQAVGPCLAPAAAGPSSWTPTCSAPWQTRAGP